MDVPIRGVNIGKIAGILKSWLELPLWKRTVTIQRCHLKLWHFNTCVLCAADFQGHHVLLVCVRIITQHEYAYFFFVNFNIDYYTQEIQIRRIIITAPIISWSINFLTDKVIGFNEKRCVSSGGFQ